MEITDDRMFFEQVGGHLVPRLTAPPECLCLAAAAAASKLSPATLRQMWLATWGGIADAIDGSGEDDEPSERATAESPLFEDVAGHAIPRLTVPLSRCIRLDEAAARFGLRESTLRQMWLATWGEVVGFRETREYDARDIARRFNIPIEKLAAAN
jgi:hypothetical protein